LGWICRSGAEGVKAIRFVGAPLVTVAVIVVVRVRVFPRVAGRESTTTPPNTMVCGPGVVAAVQPEPTGLLLPWQAMYVHWMMFVICQGFAPTVIFDLVRMPLAEVIVVKGIPSTVAVPVLFGGVPVTLKRFQPPAESFSQVLFKR